MIVHAPHSDRAVQEFRARSGAKNTFWINELTKYVKAQGLWDSFRLYPFQNRTNAGTGSTAYGLGDLTSNEMTLVNGPTWGASGLAFASASSQYGSIPDFLGSETLTCFLRTTSGSLSPGEALLSQYDTGANDRGWMYYKSSSSSLMWMSESDNGANVYRERGGNQNTSIDTCHVLQYASNGDLANWLNKISQSFSADLGTKPSSRNDSSATVLLSAFQSSGTPVNFSDQTAHALAFVTGTLTTAQRETITDYINLIGTPPPDADVVEFAARSGATDLLSITDRKSVV